MNENKRTPQIRFKGFTDDWEQRKLGDVYKFQYGEFNNNPDNGGRYPVYGANGIIGGYTKYNAQDSVIIGHMGEYAGSVLWGEGKHFVTYNGTISRPKDLSISSKFGYYMLLQKNINKVCGGSGLPFLSYEQLNKIDIDYPSKEIEQLKISQLLTNIDNLITLHQRKYDKLVNMKKSMLEKMFPKNSEKVPEIRFKGFTDDWEQRKLGELGKAISGTGFPEREQGGQKGIPFYKISDMNIDGNEHEMNVANNYVTADQISNNHWNVINDVPAVLFAKVGAAVMLNRKRLCRFPFLLDNNSMTYVFDKKVLIPKYSKIMFEKIYLPSLVQVGALPSYNATQVENIEINIPNIDEQTRIGNLFYKIDNLITLHQRKLEKLNNLKKSMLEKIFV